MTRYSSASARLYSDGVEGELPETERHWLHVLGIFNEAQARLFVAQKALTDGRGAVSRLARLTGMSRPTILKGMAELTAGRLPSRPSSGRIRTLGGGRKRVEGCGSAHQAGASAAGRSQHGWGSNELPGVDEQVDAYVGRGARPARLYGLACDRSALLAETGYSLQSNVKTIEGTQDPHRDAQFRYLNKQVRRFVRRRDPVVSVDTKKKGLIGRFENHGRWERQGEAEAVVVHDFPSQGVGKAIPYCTYDVTRDEAVVNVGITHETAEFAVESIRRWWQLLGRKAYPYL